MLQTAQPSNSGPSPTTTTTVLPLPNNGDQTVHSNTARRTATVVLVSALVPLLFLGIIVMLFIRWRRRRRSAAANERAQRFVGIPLDLHAQLRRGETNEALRVGKTPFHRVMHPQRKGALPGTLLRAGENHIPARAMFARAEHALDTASADRIASARQAQLRLAEENLALRMRIREMEGLAMSNVHSSGGRASAAESVAPPDYEEVGIVL